MKKNIILLCGMPGSGKTTLLNTLIKNVPQAFPLSLDTIQETLYDTVGFKSLEERRKLRKAALMLALKWVTRRLKTIVFQF